MTIDSVLKTESNLSKGTLSRPKLAVLEKLTTLSPCANVQTLEPLFLSGGQTYLEEKRRKQFQKQTEHGRPKDLERIERNDVPHLRTKKQSTDLRRHLERRFAEAVETYLVKLTTYVSKSPPSQPSPVTLLYSAIKRHCLTITRVKELRFAD